MSAELNTHNTRVSMMTGDLTPDNTGLRVVDGALGSVNISNTLTQVKLNILLSVNTLNLDQRVVGVLGTKTTGVPKDTAFRIQSKKG